MVLFVPVPGHCLHFTFHWFCLIPQGSPAVATHCICRVLVFAFAYVTIYNRDLFVYTPDSVTSQRVIMEREQPTKRSETLQNLKERLAV